jgi:hypothetical protein
VVQNFSLGGAVEFDSVSGTPDFVQVAVAPDVGYELALSDSWSFWPSASVAVFVPNRGASGVSLGVFAPFLIHPAEHFFFGIGPGLSQSITSNPATQIYGAFDIGGYFNR